MKHEEKCIGQNVFANRCAKGAKGIKRIEIKAMRPLHPLRQFGHLTLRKSKGPLSGGTATH